jgi:hypothetical protein
MHTKIKSGGLFAFALATASLFPLFARDCLAQADYSVVNLNPLFIGETSQALSINGHQQVGRGTALTQSINEDHALLWSGTAVSVVDLTPKGFDEAIADGISGNQQVGVGVGSATHYNHHALLWTGSADSW